MHCLPTLKRLDRTRETGKQTHYAQTWDCHVLRTSSDVTAWNHCLRTRQGQRKQLVHIELLQLKSHSDIPHIAVKSTIFDGRAFDSKLTM